MSPADRDALSLSFLPISGSRPVEWRISDELVDYETALREMDERVCDAHMHTHTIHPQ